MGKISYHEGSGTPDRASACALLFRRHLKVTEEDLQPDMVLVHLMKDHDIDVHDLLHNRTEKRVIAFVKKYDAVYSKLQR